MYRWEKASCRDRAAHSDSGISAREPYCSVCFCVQPTARLTESYKQNCAGSCSLDDHCRAGVQKHLAPHGAKWWRLGTLEHPYICSSKAFFGAAAYSLLIILLKRMSVCPACASVLTLWHLRRPPSAFPEFQHTDGKPKP